MSIQDKFFRVEVLSKTPDPQRVIYAALHQEEFIEFTLTNSDLKSFVSKIDKDLIVQHKWFLTSVGYVARSLYDPSNQKSNIIYLHREIAERIGMPQNCLVDHKNTQKLDNRRFNLRPSSKSQNMSNRGKNKNNSSGFKGVRFHTITGKWHAYIKIDYKQKHLGLFLSKEDAAKAYNAAAIMYHGDFAKLNEV